MATPDELLAEIAEVGADPRRGGYSRHAFEPAERELRAWFTAQARARGMHVTTDRNTNIWAWLTEPGDDAVVTGSHLDSVPGGGAFDGALGVASALAAADVLRAEQLRPRRPIALLVFTEEEGSRFGAPCLGSRLLTGALPADHASKLRDADGTALAEVLEDFGADPGAIGRDEDALRRIGHFVELHVEQGRALADLARPVGVASSVLAHGRWRFRFRGQGNHAGATRLEERCDPMLPASRLVSAARRAASRVDGGRATVGRLVPTPGGTNVIPSSVDVWLDARGAGDRDARGIVRELSHLAGEFADGEGATVEISEESYEDAVTFDADFRSRLSTVLDQAPLVPSGAAHDAGVLAAEKSAGMLFVRNPTGISHAPEEHAEAEDCRVGAQALARVLTWLAG
ncbi:allantoate amidohydrolase [Salinifilum aidingensis]